MSLSGLQPDPSGDVTEAPRKSAGPWRVALRRLRRDRTAVICALGLSLIVLCCVLAPQYATWVGVDPFRSCLLYTSRCVEETGVGGAWDDGHTCGWSGVAATTKNGDPVLDGRQAGRGSGGAGWLRHGV